MLKNNDYAETEPNFDIVRVRVSLKRPKDIAAFAYLVAKCKDDVVVKSGRYAVNAKSLMGLYSLDLTKPVTVEFYGDIPKEAKDGLKKFILK